MKSVITLSTTNLSQLSFRVTLPPLSSRVYILHHSDSPSKTTIVQLSAPSASVETLKGKLPRYPIPPYLSSLFLFSIFKVSPISSPTVTLTNGHLTTTHDAGSGMMKVFPR